MGIPRRLIANGSQIVRRLAGSQLVRAARGNWLVVELDGPLPERSQEGFGKPMLGLLDLLRTLEAMSRDDRFEGVLLRMTGPFQSYGRALSLARTLEGLREAGKKVAVWAEGLDIDQYVIACAADRIWLPEGGGVHLIGLRSERFFLRDLLDRVGAKPEVVHIGRFKSAGETFTRDGMSDEEREQLAAWQDDLFAELTAAIARGRGLEVDAVEALIDKGPYAAVGAAEAGLIDGVVYPDQIEDALRDWALTFEARRGDPARTVQLISAYSYHGLCVAEPHLEPLLADGPRLVQMLALGNVGRGGSPRGITPGGTGVMLERLRTDASVRGVLLRIESPGGDALASDLLHRQIEKLVLEKPVVVSMGDVVASGGYYMAAAADAIYCEPGAVTGSIGVVGGKLNLAGLYEKLGVAKDGVQRGARAGLLSESKGFTADERAAVRKEMEAIYGTFVDRVAKGRSLPHDDVEEIAQGRIWSGRRAHAVGLVDTLGGPLEALADLARRAGFGDESFAVATLPRPSRLSEWLGGMLGRFGPFGRRLG